MNDTLKLDIPLVLPEVSEASDTCVRRLTSEIVSRPGVERAHVIISVGGESPILCIHYDPDIISLSRIREIAQSAGAAITGRFGHLFWNVRGIGFQRRARTVSERLLTLAGIIEAEASAAGSVRIEFDRDRITPQSIIDELGAMGVTIIDKTDAAKATVLSGTPAVQTGQDPHPWDTESHEGHEHEPPKGEEGHSHDHDGILGPNTELIFALGCGASLAVGFAIEKLAPGAPDWLPTAFYLLAYVLGGFFTLREAIDNLKLRKFEIDTLMLVAAAGAAALGAFAEGALLLFLFSLGHALEHYAMGRAKRAIEALAELAPKTAMVRRADGSTEEVPVEALAIGDEVVIKPDERIPADGFLVKGVTVTGA